VNMSAEQSRSIEREEEELEISHARVDLLRSVLYLPNKWIS